MIWMAERGKREDMGRRSGGTGMDDEGHPFDMG
jgi:hypothetical protein